MGEATDFAEAIEKAVPKALEMIVPKALTWAVFIQGNRYLNFEVHVLSGSATEESHGWNGGAVDNAARVAALAVTDLCRVIAAKCPDDHLVAFFREPSAAAYPGTPDPGLVWATVDAMVSFVPHPIALSMLSKKMLVMAYAPEAPKLDWQAVGAEGSILPLTGPEDKA